MVAKMWSFLQNYSLYIQDQLMKIFAHKQEDRDPSSQQISNFSIGSIRNINDLPLFIPPLLNLGGQDDLYNYIVQMLQRIEQNEFRNNQFLQKFKGKVSKVSRVGTNAVFLKEQFENFALPLLSGRNIRMSPDYCDLEPLELFKSKLLSKAPSIAAPIPLTPLESSSKKLRRYPSERLPLIQRSASQQRHLLNSKEVKRERVSAEAHQALSKEQKGSKYKSWKYPPRLSQQALRFFAFADGQNPSGQKQTKF